MTSKRRPLTPRRGNRPTLDRLPAAPRTQGELCFASGLVAGLSPMDTMLTFRFRPRGAIGSVREDWRAVEGDIKVAIRRYRDDQGTSG